MDLEIFACFRVAVVEDFFGYFAAGLGVEAEQAYASIEAFSRRLVAPFGMWRV